MARHSNLPYTDPWTVLGVPRDASRADIKAAFRAAALRCHPDVDPSPQATARFSDVKAAADVLLKGHQDGTAASGAWARAAAAPARPRGGGGAAVRNRTAGLWAGACLACGLAFVYGAWWTRYVLQHSTAAAAEAAGERRGAAVPQRRKLLAALLADQQQQQQHGSHACGK